LIKRDRRGCKVPLRLTAEAGFLARLGYTTRMSETPIRRWFQFSLREIALLLLALGFALAWYRERAFSEPLRFGVDYLRSLSTAKRREAILEYTDDREGIPLTVTITVPANRP
jgi:hypothetical protein